MKFKGKAARRSSDTRACHTRRMNVRRKDDTANRPRGQTSEQASFSATPVDTPGNEKSRRKDARCHKAAYPLLPGLSVVDIALGLRVLPGVERSKGKSEPQVQRGGRWRAVSRSHAFADEKCRHVNCCGFANLALYKTHPREL